MWIIRSGLFYFAETTEAERAGSLVSDDERIVILSAHGLSVEPTNADKFVSGSGADEQEFSIIRTRRIRPHDVTLGFRLIVED